MLSDIGGLQGILLSFCVAFLVLWNHNNFDNYLASRLYKIQDDTDSQSDVQNTRLSTGSKTPVGSFIEPTKWCNIYEYMLDAIPNCLKCKKCSCRKTRTMQSIEQARVQMDEEINIVEIIKSLRYFNMALRLLLTKE